MSVIDESPRMWQSPATAVARILMEWRETERQMALVARESDEFRRLSAEAERLRLAYRDLVEDPFRRR